MMIFFSESVWGLTLTHLTKEYAQFKGSTATLSGLADQQKQVHSLA